MTPHNRAIEGEIAETVLMPGDPLRAKFIAENFLEDVTLFNDVRGMLGYTGTYKGKKVSVMGSGMGVPSIGIYSYELIHFYGVKNLIRIGSCGAYSDKLKLYDVVVGMAASTDSNFAHQYKLDGTYSANCSWELLRKTYEASKEQNIDINVGNVFCSDIFYNASPEDWKKWAQMGVLAVDMESYALYCNANYAGVDAITILTVSDSFHFKEITTPEERQNSFTTMMKLALEIA